MAIKLQIAKGELNEEDWNFFLRGGTVLDRSTQPPKPKVDWLEDVAWDNITELENQLSETFAGLSTAISHSPKEWERWYRHPEPEKSPLPAEWETKCEESLKKMIILRCLREDRLVFACTNYVEEKMKKEFIETKPTKLSEIYESSTAKEPIIFILSPGVDPSDVLNNYAIQRDMKVETISLGKGQSDKAKNYLQEGAQKGIWVFLANCHLSVSLLPELEAAMDTVLEGDISENFRIFMSSNPHPKFPISLLQRSEKMTSEPPKSIRQNMIRMLTNIPEFVKVDQEIWYRKAMFGLCWFHALLIERKKFKTLGYNVIYQFNDSDFTVCEDLLANYMGRYSNGDEIAEYDKNIPWQAIQFLIADANYGGRVTDDYDRRLIKVYSMEIFNEDLVMAEDRWRPPNTGELGYIYPDESVIKVPQDVTQSPFDPLFFIEDINKSMPLLDRPEAFGQHENAQITSQKIDANAILDDLLILTPQKQSGEGGSSDNKILLMIKDLQDNLPHPLDIREIKQRHKKDDSPNKVVLLQEITRYNILLKSLKKSLRVLEQGINGIVVISEEYEEIMINLNDNKVPKVWLFAYDSVKPLAAWSRDLKDRYRFFEDWALKSVPYIFWIGAFTYPTGFTTALKQAYSREKSVPIDKLEFDFQNIHPNPNALMDKPREGGAYIRGLYLEGAKWDIDRNCLIDSEPMKLYDELPVIHFKPIQKRPGGKTNFYNCPAYYYPIRAGSVSRDSFMIEIEVRTGDFKPEFWIKRGTAILMSLAF